MNVRETERGGGREEKEEKEREREKRGWTKKAERKRNKEGGILSERERGRRGRTARMREITGVRMLRASPFCLNAVYAVARQQPLRSIHI